MMWPESSGRRLPENSICRSVRAKLNQRINPLLPQFQSSVLLMQASLRRFRPIVARWMRPINKDTFVIGMDSEIRVRNSQRRQVWISTSWLVWCDRNVRNFHDIPNELAAYQHQIVFTKMFED